MNRHHTTGLNLLYDFAKPAEKGSVFDCIRECRAKAG